MLFAAVHGNCAVTVGDDNPITQFIRSVRLFVLEYFKALSQLRRATLAAPFTGSKSGRSPAHQRILAKLDLGARSRSCGSCFFCFAPGPASALPPCPLSRSLLGAKRT